MKKKFILIFIVFLFLSNCGYSSIHYGENIKTFKLTILKKFVEKPWKINSGSFHSKSKNSPFDGILVEGKNLMTFVRGRLVYKS